MTPLKITLIVIGGIFLGYIGGWLRKKQVKRKAVKFNELMRRIKGE